MASRGSWGSSGGSPCSSCHQNLSWRAGLCLACYELAYQVPCVECDRTTIGPDLTGRCTWCSPVAHAGLVLTCKICQHQEDGLCLKKMPPKAQLHIPIPDMEVLPTWCPYKRTKGAYCPACKLFLHANETARGKFGVLCVRCETYVTVKP